MTKLEMFLFFDLDLELDFDEAIESVEDKWDNLLNEGI